MVDPHPIPTASNAPISNARFSSKSVQNSVRKCQNIPTAGQKKVRPASERTKMVSTVRFVLVRSKPFWYTRTPYNVSPERRFDVRKWNVPFSKDGQNRVTTFVLYSELGMDVEKKYTLTKIVLKVYQKGVRCCGNAMSLP